MMGPIDCRDPMLRSPRPTLHPKRIEVDKGGDKEDFIQNIAL